MLSFPGHPADQLTYLSRQAVIACCDAIDINTVVERALRQHGDGETLLPNEACLHWQTADGDRARSLAMPAGVADAEGLRLGVKVINSSRGNPNRGLARAEGVLLLFDPETAWPRIVMESAYVSAMRTAAVTAVGARYLGRTPVRTVALLGCGALARANLIQLYQWLPDLTSVRLFDVVPDRCDALARDIESDVELRALDVTRTADPRECVRAADLVVPVTTTDRGYLRHDWFESGALIVHVSLDDVLPEVVHRAAMVVVDDWNLVSQDRNRLLGRMYAAGELRGPDGDRFPGAPQDKAAPEVAATLGQIVAGRRPGRRSPDDVILCNPFGMAVLDVALGAAIADVATEKGLGLSIPR